MEELEARLARVGFAEPKIKEVVKNTNVATALGEIILESDYSKTPALLHHLALLSRGASPEDKKHRTLVSRAIADKRLVSPQQVDAAWKYVTSTASPTPEGLDQESGVGIVVTEDQIRSEVREYIANHKAEIEENRYKALPSVLVAVKKIRAMKWANPAQFKPMIDAEFLSLLGPKDERDNPKAKAKQTKQAKAQNNVHDAKKSDADISNKSMFREGFLAHLHKAGENEQKYPQLMKEHLAFTKGQVMTRFPPEPNGFLHIGHAKAIAVNFGYAAFNNGKCYLRFDDTNPEAEDDRFAKSIQDLVKWLGFVPFEITWSSDYFDQLYELAEVLIKNDGAYVCFCTPEEVKKHRGINEDGSKGGERTPCVHRSYSPKKNLELFREMKDGKYGKGKATLRMKQNLANPNPQMWDLVAYRVMDAPHHRTGTKWKIYPTYDFTHCLVDSMENISHSLCTLEFRLSRESYEWLCDAVKMYRPAQREFGRLNLVGSVMSKRKILKLVDEGYVRGWDDPRLYTLVALRRRGIPPGAILAFISELGVTTTTSQIETERLEGSVRKYLENTVPRLMMVLNPLKVILDNLPDDFHEMISLPFKPGSPEMGEHLVPFTKTIYVDRSDFREEASANYFRLTPGQSVGLLRVPHNIRVTSFVKDSAGQVVELHAHYENDMPPKKPKTFIQWVAESPRDHSPIRLAEVREFSRLFKSDNPSAHPDGFLADINPHSEHIFKDAVIEIGLTEVRQKSPWRPNAHDQAQDPEVTILQGHDEKGAPEAVRFQALRVGYFCLDKDSTDDAIVLNQIVTLKEDKDKGKV